MEPDGSLRVHPEFRYKARREALKSEKLFEYGLRLSPVQSNALRFVEGIRDGDYTPNSRLMLPLAAFCHSADMKSARAFYDFPRTDDAWTGAARSAD